MSKQPKKRSIGAPMKTVYLIDKLDDHQLYTPATVAALSLDPKIEPAKYERAKKSLWAFAKYHNFHESADGHIKKFKAWKGWRWKDAVRPEDWALLQKQTNINAPPPPRNSVRRFWPRVRPWAFLALPFLFALGLLLLTRQGRQPALKTLSIQDYAMVRRGERLEKVSVVAQFERPPLAIFMESAASFPHRLSHGDSLHATPPIWVVARVPTIDENSEF